MIIFKFKLGTFANRLTVGVTMSGARCITYQLKLLTTNNF